MASAQMVSTVIVNVYFYISTLPVRKNYLASLSVPSPVLTFGAEKTNRFLLSDSEPRRWHKDKNNSNNKINISHTLFHLIM